MASEVKTNKISPATSTTINVGDSGDTLALATDAVTGFNVGSDAQGDILYHDGTDYTRLGAGTSGHFLKTQGTSANPVWAADSAGSLVYLASSRSAVDAATVEFQSFKSSDYLYYKILGLMHTTVDSNYIYLRFMQGASIMTASSYYYISGGVDSDGTANHDSGAGTASAMLFAQTDSSGMPQMFELNVRLQDSSSVYARSTFNGMVTGYAQANLMAERTVGGWYDVDNDAIDGCVFSYPSGNVDYHNIAVYGMKGS